MKKLLLVFGVAEPEDALNTMKELGLEFAIVSRETDLESACTEVTVETADTNAFVQKVEDQSYEFEMLIEIVDIETNESVFEQ